MTPRGYVVGPAAARGPVRSHGLDEMTDAEQTDSVEALAGQQRLVVLEVVRTAARAVEPVRRRARRRRSPDVEVQYFSWRTALLGRYDVFHVHWPEVLVRGRTRWRAMARSLLFVLVLARLRLTTARPGPDAAQRPTPRGPAPPPSACAADRRPGHHAVDRPDRSRRRADRHRSSSCRTVTTATGSQPSLPRTRFPDDCSTSVACVGTRASRPS